uniref:Venom toxin meuVNP-1A n=1 Tax=Mesobuthus eupeus TaxID=34648 RepID=A0A146CJC6_MESEU|nr:venom toxin meuVNP-1A [Mesobuthus eupeus]
MKIVVVYFLTLILVLSLHNQIAGAEHFDPALAAGAGRLDPAIAGAAFGEMKERSLEAGAGRFDKALRQVYSPTSARSSLRGARRYPFGG